MPSIPQASEQTTYLYAFRAGRTGFVKVGITSDPFGRLKRAQTDCPYEIRYVGCIECSRAYDVEQWMHGQLRHRHVRGEWFWVWGDARIHALVRKAIRLIERGELPEAPPYWERLRPWMARKHEPRIIVIPPSAIPSKPPRYTVDRTRQAVMDELLTHGWTVADLRREGIFRGDNAVIGQEVVETRNRLGIADPDRTLKIRDMKGEREIPMETPAERARATR